MKADDRARKLDRTYAAGHSRYSRRRRHRTRGWRAWVAPLALVASIIGVALLYDWMAASPLAEVATVGADATAGRPAERTAALAPLTLPADDAPHASGMEWWYYNGILNAKDGPQYAFHVAVFVSNGLVKHTVMHAALTDLQTGKRYAGQSRTGGIPANSIPGGFDFTQQGWRVMGSGPIHRVRVDFEGVSLALDLTDSRPAVLHRAAGSNAPGLLDFGQSGISYYYSRPRMSARGEVSVAGKPVPVSGDVWFDHQWGDFDVSALGWNWFALRLADGSDVMLYALFDTAGHRVMTSGTVSNAKGAVPLKPGDIELTPGSTWTSPRTQISYVVTWKVKLPSGVLDIKPWLEDGEFDSRETTANIYWEGPVKVTGDASGYGFLEMSGYDRLKTAQAGR